MNEKIRSLLEEARSLAAALPEFAGMELVKKLNEILQRAPAARKPHRPCWPRAVEDPPEAA